MEPLPLVFSAALHMSIVSGSTCSEGCALAVPNHQQSAWGGTEARQEKVILEVVRKGTFVVKNVGVFVEHIYKCFLSVLS